MAAVTAAVIAGGTALYAADKQGDAAKDAARAQSNASDRASQVQWDIFNRIWDANEGARQDGNAARQMYMQMMGFAPTQQAQTPTAPTLPPSGGPAGPLPPGGLGGGRLRELVGERGGGFGMQRAQAPVSGLGGLLARTGGPGQVSGGPAPTATTGVPQAGGNFQQSMTDLLRSTPGYQWNLTQGQKQLDSSAAARGGLYSGAQGKASIEYGQNFADRIFGDHMNRLASAAGMGQTANAQNAQAGMNYANQVGQNYINAGNARASGLYGQANASGQLAGNIAGIAGWLGGQWGGGG